MNEIEKILEQNKNQEKTTEYGVFIARMQPLHEGHLYIVRRMLQNCKNVVIVLGSQNKKDMIRNPFSFRMREKWLKDTIKEELGPEAAKRIQCFSLPDWSTEKDNSQEWGAYLYYNVVARIKHKHFTIYYTDGLEQLKSWFPKAVLDRIGIWYEDREASGKFLGGLSATKLRQAFEKDDKEYVMRYCPKPVVRSYEQAKKIWLRVRKNPREDFSME